VKLREALLGAKSPAVGPVYRLHLCCGFEPLHLGTFLKAHLRARLAPEDGSPGRSAEVLTGLFGELRGNIDRAIATEAALPLAVVVDWADIDPRLGLREGYLLKTDIEVSILAEAVTRLTQLELILTSGASGRRIVMALPSSPLPPWLPGLPEQASATELQLRALLYGLAARCAAAGIRVASPVPGPAYDIRAHLSSGFPLQNAYADSIAAALAALLLPGTPKKGLVTDLDNTVWRGIVGEDGPENVHWALEQNARVHGLYQQFLAGLHAQGTLLGIASKNDPGPVSEALARPGFLFPTSALFPVEANWGPKSESIRRIAARWNIGLDAIVFVDDSPFELAEVQQSLPAVECHLFSASDPVAVLELINTLRARFARDRITDEDRLRAASLRQSAELVDAAKDSDPETLLSALDARIKVAFSRDPLDPRALELLNKTNQFNLNGERWEESGFQRFLATPGSLLCVASYEDRFGPLGKIAVAAGSMDNKNLRLTSWVLSCRAFSRRIEFAMLEALFAHTGVDAIEMVWKTTPKNNATRDALSVLFDQLPEQGILLLSRAQFVVRCPHVYAALQMDPLGPAIETA
jgi:FkbH-like protein